MIEQGVITETSSKRHWMELKGPICLIKLTAFEKLATNLVKIIILKIGGRVTKMLKI